MLTCYNSAPRNFPRKFKFQGPVKRPIFTFSKRNPSFSTAVRLNYQLAKVTATLQINMAPVGVVSVTRCRLETNYLRLLEKCETMALETKTDSGDNWRLEKYTEALQEMLAELKNGPNQPDRDLLLEYTRRLDLLKGVLQTAKLPTVEEKFVASQLIQPSRSDGSGSDLGRSMEIKQRHQTKYSEDMRKELFGTSGKAAAEKEKNDEGSQDLDQLLKYEHQRQEKIAEHMLGLTRSLKEQVSLAGQIVKNDTKVLEKSSIQIDSTQDKLKTESEKLEVFSKRACKCWVWFMLVIVCSTFIGMVLFMRLFRKRVVIPVETATPSSHSEL